MTSTVSRKAILAVVTLAAAASVIAALPIPGKEKEAHLLPRSNDRRRHGGVSRRKKAGRKGLGRRQGDGDISVEGFITSVEQYVEASRELGQEFEG